MKTKAKRNSTAVKLPVVRGKNHLFPADGVCPICRKRKVFGEHEHVTIDGGALLLGAKRKDGSRPARLLKNLEAFLWADWYSGAPLDDYLSDAEWVETEIASDVEKGQFHLAFCSTDCLKEFFHRVVDNLETKIAIYKKEKQRRSR